MRFLGNYVLSSAVLILRCLSIHSAPGTPYPVENFAGGGGGQCAAQHDRGLAQTSSPNTIHAVAEAACRLCVRAWK